MTTEHTKGPPEECPTCIEEWRRWWEDESRLFRNSRSGHLERRSGKIMRCEACEAGKHQDCDGSIIENGVLYCACDHTRIDEGPEYR